MNGMYCCHLSKHRNHRLKHVPYPAKERYVLIESSSQVVCGFCFSGLIPRTRDVFVLFVEQTELAVLIIG